MKQFHRYVFGREFIIYTDHKPLLGLFKEDCLKCMAAARLIRWSLILGAYMYKIRYKPGKELGNADGLSHAQGTYRTYQNPNSKQWNDETTAYTAPKQCSKIEHLKFSNKLITIKIDFYQLLIQIHSKIMPEIHVSRLKQQISVVMFENSGTILSFWGTLV